MTEDFITDDERRCLRMWFRQAIVQIEREEVTAQIFAEKYADDKGATHRSPTPRRRTRARQTLLPHLKELVY